MERPRNPFRTVLMRRQFEQVVECFDTKHSSLFTADGKPMRGSSFATQFWRGYFGEMERGRFDLESRRSAGYIYFRAGEEIRKVVGGVDLEAFRR